MTLGSTRAETNALLAALLAVHGRVGDAIAPVDLTLPYAVLYPTGSGPLDGPVSDPNADTPGLYQITCVAGTREQAQWLADKLRPVPLGSLTITGRRVLESSLQTSQPVRRDDSTQPALFYAVDVFLISTTPA